MNRRFPFAEVVGIEPGISRFEGHRPDISVQDRAEWYERRYEETIAERDAALEAVRRLEAASLATTIDASAHESTLARALDQLLAATRKRNGLYGPRLLLARTRAAAALERLERARRPPAATTEGAHRLTGPGRRERRRGLTGSPVPSR